MSISNMVNPLALAELSNALAVLEAPHEKLPEVKNHNGEVVTDAKEKRLALVRKHIQAAGDIINLADQVDIAAAQEVQMVLAQKYRPQLEAAAKKLLGENFKGKLPFADAGCDCENCRARRAANPDEDEPARQMGFGAAIPRK